MCPFRTYHAQQLQKTPMLEGKMAGYDDRDGKIWMDGKLVEWRDANVHILTHALHYASAGFEGEA